MNREELISIAIKYEGNYTKIIEAIKTNEKVKLISAQAITIFDEEYPKCLFDLKQPPLVLFYKGNLSLLKENNLIAVVGSRNPCDYSLKATKALVKNKSGDVIISGLAKGIDACAHWQANKTIGILGCGINYYYPYSNKDLIDEMANKQLIISEYPDKVKPLAYHFPFRNRIIAALAKDVYVMECKEYSGTMTTINEALQLGKNVKVLPFDIFTNEGKINNRLIQEGAEIIDTEEIFV